MIISADADTIEVSDFDRTFDSDVFTEIARYPVAMIADVMRRMGVVEGIRPVTEHATVAGPVLPVLCREGDNLAVHRALDEARKGDVLVINALGLTSRAVFGGILAEAFQAIGVAGVVVDGAVRDIRELQDLGLPVFARGVTPAGPFKDGPGSVGLSVACGATVCHPGDLMVGDSDGLVVLRPQRLQTVLERLHKQVEIEDDLRARIWQLQQ